ncbi:MAG TPA: TolC family protein [Thermoanaerobaculia bacterium]|nr:TolC family protein [Thermoanaerobaculia bacterium]
MRNADSFDSRTAGRRAVAWLLLLVLPLTAAGPLAAARPPQGGASPAPAPSEPPAQAPAAAADQGMPAAPAAPEPVANGVPAGAVGGLAPSDRITVDVLQMDPEVGELHLDIANNVLSLTLDQAVEIALRRNLALILQRYLRNEARLGVPQALGIYDLNLTGNASAMSNRIPITATTNGNETSRDFNLGLSQLVPTGGTATVTWDNPRSFFPEPVTLANGVTTTGGVPFYEPTLNFTFTQPLLQKFGTTVTDQGILLALNTSTSNRVQFELSAITVSVQLIDSYWNLVNAREQLVVAQESLQLARDLNNRNIIQVQIGTLAPLEIVQSQAAIATREQEIITAQQAIGDAADALRLAMNLPQDLYQYDILPTTPAESDTIQINLDESIKTALDNRVEVHQEQLNVERAKINAAVAKNGLLPTLNLTANYNADGFSNAFGSSLNQLGGFDFPGWSIGLHFAFPLQNRAARATDVIAKLDVERFNRELEQERKTVINEVRRAVRGIETAEKVIVAAHLSRGFQEKNLDAEKKRYENGMSTSFLITQIQDQLTLAKQSEVNAVVGYRTALAEYYRSIGKLMPELGVKFLDPKEQVNRFSFRPANLLP